MLAFLGVGRVGLALILMWRLTGHIQPWNLGVLGQPWTHFLTAGAFEGVDGSFQSLLEGCDRRRCPALLGPPQGSAPP